MRIYTLIIPAVLIISASSFAPQRANGQLYFGTTGGNVTLQVGQPVAAGLDPTPAESSSSGLFWILSPVLTSKIIVTSVAPGQSFQLFLSASNISSGNSAGEVQLTDGMLPADLVVNVRRLGLFGSATLNYRAEAPAELGNSASQGDDVHTVIFTWTAQ